MGGARTRTPISRNGNLCMTQMDESRWRISYATPRIPRNSGRKGMNEPQRLLLCSGHTVFALSPQRHCARHCAGARLQQRAAFAQPEKQSPNRLFIVCLPSPSARIYHAFTFSSMQFSVNQVAPCDLSLGSLGVIQCFTVLMLDVIHLPRVRFSRYHHCTYLSVLFSSVTIFHRIKFREFILCLCRCFTCVMIA